MPQYVFSYHRSDEVVTGDPEVAAEWMQWFGSIQSHVVEMGAPVGETRRLGNVDSDQIIGGYSIISADSLDHAAELAAGCPVLKAGQGLEIGELVEVPTHA
ncbi:MAG: YciI family protein [Conexibacteraceae bacterium]|nr:YciI family protein [Conexibacteraceae bacterium]